MRLKENLSIRKIGDEYMMVSENGSSLDYTRVISLNSSAAYLIQQAGQENFTKENWVDMLTSEYGIDKETADADVQKLIDKLVKEGLIDE
jgi:hypothetical protein